MIFTPETQSRDEWLDNRKTYLGGTDIAAILSLNKYRSPYDVYAEKVLGERSETSRKAEAGTALEPLVRKWYSEELGVQIAEAGTIRNDEYPFLAANIDGYIPGVCVWECKTYDFSTAQNWGEANTDQVPVHYWAQVQWYTGFAKLPYAVIVALDRGTMDYTCYEVKHDPETFALMIKQGVKFWNDHVLAGVAPDLTTADTGRIAELFPEPTVAEPLISTPELDAVIDEAMDLANKVKPLNDHLKDLKAQIHIACAEYPGIHSAWGVVKHVRKKAGASYIKLPTR